MPVMSYEWKKIFTSMLAYTRLSNGERSVELTQLLN